jgi:hypothetical protein
MKTAERESKLALRNDVTGRKSKVPQAKMCKCTERKEAGEAQNMESTLNGRQERDKVIDKNILYIIKQINKISCVRGRYREKWDLKLREENRQAKQCVDVGWKN